MAVGITYHDPQIDGNRLDSVDLGIEDGVCSLVMQAYQRGMSEKIRCGLQARLRAAYDYQTSDRVDQLIFHSVEKDGPTEEDCEGDCGNELFAVNLDMIRLQVDTAMSIYMDALKSRGNDYVTVDPTPIPDTSDESREKIAISAFNSVMRDLVNVVAQRATSMEEADAMLLGVLEGLVGTQEGLDRVDEFVTRQKMIENSKLLSEARRKAQNAKKDIDDKLVESNYDDAMASFAGNAFWYDYSVMYAPYTRSVDTTEIKGGKLAEVTKQEWAMKVLNPVNHFFSENTTYLDMGDYEGDVVWMSRNDIKFQGSLDGGNPEAVNHILDNFVAYQTLFTNSGTVEEEYEDSIWEFNDRAPVIRLMIRLDDDQVKELFPKANLKKGKASHIVELMCVRDQVIYQKLYPRYKEYNPYRKNAFTIVDMENIASSRGLYSICRTAQEMIDNSLVAVFQNMDELNQYILEVNESKLTDPDELEDDLDSDRPIIRTKGTANYAQYGGNDRAIHLMGVPDNLNSFTNTLLQGISLMEKVGFSAFALGQGNFANVRSTGQTAILQSNSNKRFGRFLQQQEAFVETPIADYIWTDESIKNRDPSTLVDSTISIKSYSGFLQKEEQAGNTSIFMQSLVGFMSARAQLKQAGEDITFFDSLLKQFVESNGYSTDDLNVSPSLGILGEGTQDIVAQPAAQLDGRSNVPPDINEV